MDKVEDEFGFNEEKARKLVYYLLEDDIRAFKKLIPEIKGMDSISFENLFNGIPFKEKKKKEEIEEEDEEDETYDYKVKTQSKKGFKELLNKFDNFRSVLDEWYLDERYNKYIKELWKNYISIENLKEKDIKLVEDILKSNKIDYINWPEDIKDEFKRIIANSGETRIMTLKNIIQNDLYQYNNVIEHLIQLKNKMEEKKEEDKVLKIDTQQMIKSVLRTAAIFAIGIAIEQGKQAIDIKQIKAVKKYIRNGTNGLSDSKINGLVDQLLEKIEGDVGSKTRRLSQNFDYWYSPNTLNGYDDELDISCLDGKLDFLKSSQKVKAFFKSNAVCGLHAALSFLNLVYSIYEIRNTYKGFKENKIYNSKLDEIEKKFNDHRKEIGILSEDVKESSKKIKEVLDLIWQDFKDLQDLIKAINESIKFQESQQTTAVLGAALSVGLGIAGAVGSISTCNITSAIYCVSTVENVISGVTYVTDFIMSKKIVDKLGKTLKRAEGLSKDMQNEIDNILKKLSLEGGEYAKFDLSESCSSVSTNV